MESNFTPGTPGTGTETPENIEKNEVSVPEPVETTPEAMLDAKIQLAHMAQLSKARTIIMRIRASGGDICLSRDGFGVNVNTDNDSLFQYACDHYPQIIACLYSEVSRSAAELLCGK